jgi:hypothetical protein
MLLYVDELMCEIEAITEYAAIVREKFNQGRPPAELLLDARALRLRVENLQAMMPEGTDTGNLRRHSGWMIYWLEREAPNSCTQDIENIVDFDLPHTKAEVQKWSRQLMYVDAELRAQVLPLLRTKQFDSAIRKAFVILKARLCAKFGLAEIEDGARLINQIFAANSPHLPDMEAGQKQAYRDLFAGLFGLLRNKFAHNDAEPTLSELDTVLSTINLCLSVVGDFRREEVGDVPA